MIIYICEIDVIIEKKHMLCMTLCVYMGKDQKMVDKRLLSLPSRVSLCNCLFLSKVDMTFLSA